MAAVGTITMPVSLRVGDAGEHSIGEISIDLAGTPAEGGTVLRPREPEDGLPGRRELAALLRAAADNLEAPATEDGSG